QCLAPAGRGKGPPPTCRSVLRVRGFPHLGRLRVLLQDRCEQRHVLAHGGEELLALLRRLRDNLHRLAQAVQDNLLVLILAALSVLELGELLTLPLAQTQGVSEGDPQVLDHEVAPLLLRGSLKIGQRNTRSHSSSSPSCVRTSCG